jgi:hypothetical protein
MLDDRRVDGDRHRVCSLAEGPLVRSIAEAVLQEGFDHGVGHPLLLLYDAKTSRGQKPKEFNGLGDNPFNVSISLF